MSMRMEFTRIEMIKFMRIPYDTFESNQFSHMKRAPEGSGRPVPQNCGRL